ncbi:MAG: DNA cytosine methyltransferase [Mucilaginibacter sp.]
MKQLTLGSWYSGGIDGFAYAARQLNIETLYHIESNKDLWKYLNNIYGKNIHPPPIYRYDGFCGSKNLPWTNIIAGGDPCQPSSVSGLGLGMSDDRYRWPQMFRGITELRPDWVINENVVGTVSNMVLDQKITDLESIGYTCQAFNIPAVAVNADHTRQRIWLIANADVQRRGELLHTDFGTGFKESRKEYSLGAQGNAFLRFEESFSEPPIFPFPYGIPDQVTRLGIAGNSIVHQIPMIIMEAIKTIENI